MKKICRTNPRRFFSDWLPVKFRIFWKGKVAPLFGQAYYHEIIPETKLHHAWYLGAQPTEKLIRQFLRSIDGRRQRVHIVSMLSDQEVIIKKNSRLLSCNDIIFHRRPWYDHGNLDTATGRNQNVSDFVEFQRALYPLFTKKKAKKNNSFAEIFYCHCMAGRSRSLVETLAFFYFYPKKEELFDFGNWPAKSLPTEDLQRRLRNQPTFGDLAEFVKSRRRQVRNLANLDGDQLGLLGLLALHGYAHGAICDKSSALAQEIGFMLKAPLDYAFRSELDRQAQEDNLHFVYSKLLKQDVNLLASLRFNQLSPSEQARFAILMQKLRGARSRCPADSFSLSSSSLTKLAVRWPKKLTAGDQVELLRTFGHGLIPPLSCATIARRIMRGNRLDRYNDDIQLAELTSVLLHRLR